MTLFEVNAAAEVIYEVVDPNANIIFGAVIDKHLEGELQITVIATGFVGEQVGTSLQEAKLPRTGSEKSSAAKPTPTSTLGLDIPEFLQHRRPSRS